MAWHDCILLSCHTLPERDIAVASGCRRHAAGVAAVAARDVSGSGRGFNWTGLEFKPGSTVYTPAGKAVVMNPPAEVTTVEFPLWLAEVLAAGVAGVVVLEMVAASREGWRRSMRGLRLRFAGNPRVRWSGMRVGGGSWGKKRA